MVVFVEPERDLIKRRHRMKKNSAHAEIQYCFMFASRASVLHCTDCNECELSHSDGKKTSELNKGRVGEIMHTGSCYYGSE